MRTITNARTSTHRHARVNADNPTEKGKQTGVMGSPGRSSNGGTVEEDQQELETREKKRTVEDVQRIRRMVHEIDKSKIPSHMQNEMGNSCIKTSRSCSACGTVGIGMTTKAGGLIQGCAPKRDKKKWSTFVATGCTQESPVKSAHARPEGHPSRQDGRKLTRGNQESPMCARDGSRRSTRHTRDQSCMRQRHRWRR